MKVILDTDIGSDIDDAVCLAYLLAQPACDLLGITTVTGEPVRRARWPAPCAGCRKRSPSTPAPAAAARPPTPDHARRPRRWPAWIHEAFPPRRGGRVPAPHHPRPPGRDHPADHRPADQHRAAVQPRPRNSGPAQGVGGDERRVHQPAGGGGPTGMERLLDPHATAIGYRRRPAFIARSGWT